MLLGHQREWWRHQYYLLVELLQAPGQNQSSHFIPSSKIQAQVVKPRQHLYQQEVEEDQVWQGEPPSQLQKVDSNQRTSDETLENWNNWLERNKCV